MHGTESLLRRLDLDPDALREGDLEVRTPITGEVIARVPRTVGGRRRRRDRPRAGRRSRPGATSPPRGAASSCACSARSCARRRTRSARWSRSRPARSSQEGLGEVQEMIDICDFAVGLSRQLYGLTIASERPGHRMIETWHPLGPVAVDHARSTSRSRSGLERRAGARLRRPRDLEAVREDAAHRARLPGAAAARRGSACGGRARRAVRGRRRRRRPRGEQLADDPRVPLVSATGSTAMGRAVGAARSPRGSGAVAARARRQQRDDRDAERRPRSRGARDRVRGRRHRRPALHDPAPPDRARATSPTSCSAGSSAPTPACRWATRASDGTLRRPAHRRRGVRRHAGGARAGPRRRAARCIGGERALADELAGRPLRAPGARAHARRRPTSCAEETFAPILYVLRYRELDEAIALHNAVPQGLVVVHLHERPARGRALPVAAGTRLRHRERQHRPERRRDRRRVRRREGDRRRPRVGLRRLEGLHAPPDDDDQLLARAAAGAGHRLRRRGVTAVALTS